jgi:hypothetical protein
MVNEYINMDEVVAILSREVRNKLLQLHRWRFDSSRECKRKRRRGVAGETVSPPLRLRQKSSISALIGQTLFTS